MAIKSFRHVYPGDLVTSSLFNDFADALASLRAQLDGLGPGGPPAPAPKVGVQVTPPAAPALAGATCAIAITLDGAELPAAEQFALTATFMSTDAPQVDWSQVALAVTASPGNAVQVPARQTVVVTGSFPVPADARSVSVVVHAHALTPPSTTSASSTPAGLSFGGPAPPAGLRSVSLSKARRAEVVFPGAQHRIALVLTPTALTASERFTVSVDYPLVVGGPTQAQWQAATSIEGGAVVTVQTGAPAPFFVAVDVPATAMSAVMTVRATSESGDLSSNVLQIPIDLDVGAPIDLAIGQVSGFVRRHTFTSSLPGRVAGDGLEVQQGTSAIVAIAATARLGGTYRFDAAVLNENGNSWRVSIDPGDHVVASGASVDVTLSLVQVGPFESFGVVSERYLDVSARRIGAGGPGPIANTLRIPIGATKGIHLAAGG